MSLSFSASPSKQTLTFTLFQVRILLLGSFHVEDGPLANTSAESGGCLAFLSCQRLCIHHTLQTRALAPVGKSCPIFQAGKSAKKHVYFSLEAFETARPKENFLKALYMGSILCSPQVGSAVAFCDFEHHNILWFRLGKNISEICNCQNFPEVFEGNSSKESFLTALSEGLNVKRLQPGCTISKVLAGKNKQAEDLFCGWRYRYLMLSFWK